MRRAIILTESPRKAASLLRALRGVPDVEVEAVLCNNLGVSPGRFALMLLRDWLRLRPADQARLTRMLLRGAARVFATPLHHPAVVEWVRGRGADVGLHAAAVIYREPILRCFRLGILNPHIGLLPRYRGRAVMEWSLLEGQPTGVTTFFVDEGIDTGPEIVLRRVVDVSGFSSLDQAKSYLFSLDGEMFAEALRLLGTEGFVGLRQSPHEGKRYYVMSKLFREVAAERLRMLSPSCASPSDHSTAPVAGGSGPRRGSG